MAEVKVSIVIPVHNSGETLRECLSSVVNSDYKEYELIVVDDHSIDSSVDIAKEFSCRIISTGEKRGAAAARNKGAEASIGNFLLFIDSDIVVRPDSVSKMVNRLLEDDSIDGVFGVYAARNRFNNFLSQYKHLLACYRDKICEDISQDLFRGAFFIVRKNIFNYSKFNETIKGASIEDMELGRELIYKGYKLILEKSIEVEHVKRITLKIFIKNQYNRSIDILYSILNQRYYKPSRTQKINSYGFKVYFFRELFSPLVFLLLTSFLLTRRNLFLYFSYFFIFISILTEICFLKFCLKREGLIFMIKCIFIYFFDGIICSLAIIIGAIIILMRKLIVVKNILWFKPYPPYIIFFVTSRCNMRCKHCFYWENINSVDTELKSEEIEKIAKSLPYLSFLRITGGEPFLKGDLYEIVESFYRNSSVRRISINTNGSLSEEAIRLADSLTKNLPDLKIEIMISIDHLNEVHDRIRCFPGSFNLAMKTYDGLVKIREMKPSLRLGFLITMMKDNQDDLDSIYSYLKSKKPDSISLNIVRGSPKDISQGEVDIEKYNSFRNSLNSYNIKNYARHSFIERMRLEKTILSQNYIINMIKDNKPQFTCLAGDKIAVLYPDGRVCACELGTNDIGNIRDYNFNFQRLWKTSIRKKICARIKKEKCFCTHECFITASLIFRLKGIIKIFFMALLRNTIAEKKR